MKEAGNRHVREHDSLLASPEKRLLVGMAERLPSAVTSDHLSLIGLTAMAAAGLAFWAASWNRWFLLVVVGALGLNWLGDSLDGTVARVRGHERPRYGFYVDHVIDILGASLLLGGMAASEFMSPLVALGLLVAYLMVSAESYLATHTHGVFRLSFLRVGPTELRIVLALGALCLLRQARVELAGIDYLLFDVGGVVATVGLAIVFLAAAARNAVELYRLEPLPPRPHPDRHRQPAHRVEVREDRSSAPTVALEDRASAPVSNGRRSHADRSPTPAAVREAAR